MGRKDQTIYMSSGRFRLGAQILKAAARAKPMGWKPRARMARQVVAMGVGFGAPLVVSAPVEGATLVCGFEDEDDEGTVAPKGR